MAPAMRFPTPAAALACAVLGSGLLVACGGGDPAPAPDRRVLPDLSWDYGTIPHGRAAEHDFVIDVRALGQDLTPLGVNADCSCARAKMLFVAADGAEREATGQPLPQFTARPGERLVVRLLVDTIHKEAVDLAPVDSRATLVLQSLQDRLGQDRVLLPIRFRFGIDSPVRLRPFAALDFGRVPMSSRPTLPLAVTGDVAERPVRFGPARTSDPRLQVELQPTAEGAELRITFVPGADARPGPFQALVTLGTDLADGYEVRVPTAGTLVPDLEATPMGKLSLGMVDVVAGSPTEQFVLVTDHDRRRPPEFTVARLVDQAGTDASSHFAVRLEPVAGDPRSTRLWVRCTGGLQPPGFRGQIVLAKDAVAGPFLPIDLVAFHRAP